MDYNEHNLWLAEEDFLDPDSLRSWQSLAQTSLQDEDFKYLAEIPEENRVWDELE